MTPVSQDMNHPTGNCLQAAVASVLDMSLNSVPDFSGKRGNSKKWFKNLTVWARKNGLGVVRFNTGENNLVPEMHNVWVVAVGHTRRSGVLHDYTHAIVAKAQSTPSGITNFHFEHDPHPSQAFIEEVKYALFFTRQ